MHAGPCTKTESVSQVQKLQADLEHQAGPKGKTSHSSKGVSHETAGEHMLLDIENRLLSVCDLI